MEIAFKSIETLKKRYALTKQLLRVMKLTGILILAACLQVSAKGLGQTVTLSVHDASLRKVFSEVIRQSGVTIVYNDASIKDARPVTLDVKNATPEEVLNRCLRDQPFTFSMENNLIVVKPIADDKRKLSSENSSPHFLYPPISVYGRVTDSLGNPLVGATVQVKGTKQVAVTGNDGSFSISNVKDNGILLISFVGYSQQQILIKGKTEFDIHLSAVSTQLEDVQVTLNTGYQFIPRERATGSFEFVDSKKLNEQVGTTLFERLNGTTSLLFDNHASAMAGSYTMSSGKVPFIIRGVNTIAGNTDALIVVDNFPYNGDFNSINPNDVASVTILKDAAAASIWGAKAGNGVVVITTKKGNYNQRMKVGFNASFTTSEKPDLFTVPIIHSSDYIDIEKLKFDNGYYTNAENDPSRTSLTPVIELLIAARDGKITQEEADAQINAYRNFDTRTDLAHLGQRPMTQQYSLNLSGGSGNMNYYMSAGYSRAASETNAINERLSFNSGNTFKVNSKLSIGTSISVSALKNVSGTKAGYGVAFAGAPYIHLLGEQGQPLAVDQYRTPYLDTAGGGKLLDWHKYPATEPQHQSITNSSLALIAGVHLNYNIVRGLSVSGDYQYQYQPSQVVEDYDAESYYARDLINTYTQIDGASGEVIHNIPVGGIYRTVSGSYHTSNYRAQLSYNDNWGKHGINFIGGTDISEQIANAGASNTFYGYSKDPLIYSVVDFTNYFPTYIAGYTYSIPNSPTASTTTTNRQVSFYSNASYTYDDRFIFSISGRKDAANIFGQNINNRWKPLWSTGVTWNADKEKFYNISWLPTLNVSATYGFRGNLLDASMAPTRTAIYYPTSPGYYNNSPYGSFGQRGNPDLKWEQIKTYNLAIGFGTANHRITGRIDLYKNDDKDLYGDALMDPTAGVGISIKKNAASMTSKGFELNVTTKNIISPLNWTTSFIVSRNTNKVTAYYLELYANNQYLNTALPNPIEGHPLYALNTYKWSGLDPQTGVPMGILNGHSSEDYNTIANTLDMTSLALGGSIIPTVNGSINNNFEFKGLHLGFNVSYKFGYYFLKPSINYSRFVNGDNYPGYADYYKRWQKPGDENHTNVPAFQYANSDADYFYNTSSTLVIKGDQIRLQYMNLGYTFNKSLLRKLPFEQLSVVFNVSNLGILWRANKDGLDPDNLTSYRSSKGYSLSITSNF